ncbi:hypothetical protein R3P38DRAFT_527287 [Favolaschia claudopus]|uniref:Uncharacterized protein n=1 Tax=Favolaschia claudopus TaxID=2862362 RepID=A0AAV9ZBP4_9AGAR
MSHLMSFYGCLSISRELVFVPTCIPPSASSTGRTSLFPPLLATDPLALSVSWRLSACVSAFSPSRRRTQATSIRLASPDRPRAATPHLQESAGKTTTPPRRSLDHYHLPFPFLALPQSLDSTRSSTTAKAHSTWRVVASGGGGTYVGSEDEGGLFARVCPLVRLVAAMHLFMCGRTRADCSHCIPNRRIVRSMLHLLFGAIPLAPTAPGTVVRCRIPPPPMPHNTLHIFRFPFDFFRFVSSIRFTPAPAYSSSPSLLARAAFSSYPPPPTSLASHPPTAGPHKKSNAAK